MGSSGACPPLNISLLTELLPGLDQHPHIVDIAPANRTRAMTNAPELGQRRKINWLHVNTVLSAAVLIGAEVFGAADAGRWAVAHLLGLGEYGVLGIRILFFVGGIAVMISFVRQAQRVEPFISRG